MKSFDDIIEELGFTRGTRKFNKTLNFTKREIGTIPADFDWPSEVEFENLWLYYQDQITHLPENLSVGGDLDLQGCKSLIHLSKNLSVGRNLILWGCERITHLPENISVGGGLVLWGCKRITYLHENLSVGGNIYFYNNVTVPGEVFKNGVTYAEGKFKVVNPNYPALREIFFNIENSERRRHLINILGPDHTAKMLDALEFKTGKVGKEQVRILRTREKDRMIRSRHYWVEVRCPSTDRMYMLPIPPSRAKSCADAVAYTFGLTGKEYRPLIET